MTRAQALRLCPRGAAGAVRDPGELARYYAGPRGDVRWEHVDEALRRLVAEVAWRGGP